MKRASNSAEEATASKQQRADTVKLNVGGKKVHTTADTLCCIPFFQSLLDSSIGWAVDDEGHYFIDRSGDLFAMILQFCRTRQRPAQTLLSMYKHALLDECNYYTFDAMTEAILGKTCSWDLRSEDRAIREMEMGLRFESQERGLCSQHAPLYDVHATALHYETPEALGYPVLLNKVPRVYLKGSFQEFYERLNTISGQTLLDELIKIPHQGANLVIAGGSVLAALTGCPCNDIDIFLQVAPGDDAMQLFERIFGVIQTVHGKDAPKSRMMLTRTANAISFYRIAEKRPCAPVVQVITRVISDLASFLANFDVDSCCFAFDLGRRKVLTSKRGLRALQFGANVVDTACSGNLASYMRRLEKYTLRGFACCLPGFMPERIHPKVWKETYLHLPQFELVLKLGKCDANPKKVKVNRTQNAIEVQPRITQKGTRVEGLLRMIILDAGVAREANTPTRHLTNHGCIALVSDASAVVPVKTGVQGQHVLLYGLGMSESSLEKAWLQEAEVDEDTNYELTPMAAVVDILEKIFKLDQHGDAPDADNFVRGGFVQRLTKAAERSAGKAYRVCFQAHNASLAVASKLAFVYDVCCTETPFSRLRYILHAKVAPLKEHLPDDEFESSYGIAPKLQFEVWRPRSPIKGGLWDGIFE